MPTPVEFMNQYRRLSVKSVIDDPVAMVCREVTHQVQVRKYFMMDWDAGTEERRDYNTVTAGSNRDDWFKDNKEPIKNAAMGKGSPRDYELALEWAVRSQKIPNVSPATLQTYCDDHLGIDCSGFVTNYLIANGRKSAANNAVRNTNAASYFDASKAINDSTAVRQGDLLVWMNGNSVKRGPGHIAVVESYTPQCVPGGNMRVVEATGNGAANPKLLDSMYSVEQIINKGGAVPAMIFVVKRHGKVGDRVVVIRV